VIFRVAQESLTNAVRHGRPGVIDLELRRTERGGVLLGVTDDGTGYAPAAGAVESGVRSMRERALSIGAELEIAARDGDGGRGTRVILEVPPWTS
jgi:two-component system sensor histidine kinase UhpB